VVDKPTPAQAEEWERKLERHGLSKRQLGLADKYWGKKPESTCPVDTCSDCGNDRFRLVESDITEGAFFWRCLECGSDAAVDVTE
jgi:hypothetical protein